MCDERVIPTDAVNSRYRSNGGLAGTDAEWFGRRRHGIGIMGRRLWCWSREQRVK